MLTTVCEGQDRILFVDDEESARRIFSVCATQLGFHVDVAPDGRTAFELASENEYSIVISDLRMPDLDGVRVIARLKPLLPEASYMLTTGANELNLPANHPGAVAIDGILAKPWNLEDLSTMLSRAVRLSTERKHRASDGGSGWLGERRILLLEDNPGDAKLVTSLLADGRGHGDEYTVVHVERLASAQKLVTGEPFALALVDLSLPDASGLDAVMGLHSSEPRLPIVVLTGRADSSLAAESIHIGAQDYLCKSGLDGESLARALRYAIERKQAERRLAFLAHHDSLTGLANRSFFRDKLAHALVRAKRTGRKLGVLFVDLNGFKPVNDTVGHDAGDRLLQQVANRLRRSAREHETVARLGGDEFGLLLEDLSSVADVEKVSKRILELLEAPFPIMGKEVTIGASIGVALSPDHGRDASLLLARADAAMYRVKKRNVSGYHLFGDDLGRDSLDDAHLAEELRCALRDHRFELFYQPRMAIRDGSIVGAEALIRWRRDDRLVPAEELMPKLEEAGLLQHVEEWALRKACRQLGEWKRTSERELTVSVNVSATLLEDETLAFRAASAARQAGISPRCLELEIAEKHLVEASKRTRRRLDALKDVGVRVAIDDFGVGNSILPFLHELHVDAIKIDESVIRELPHDDRLAGIFVALLAFARQLSLDVVAEGVETEKQLRCLLRMGGRLAQGYFCGRPQPADDLANLLNLDFSVAPDSCHG